MPINCKRKGTVDVIKSSTARYFYLIAMLLLEGSRLMNPSSTKEKGDHQPLANDPRAGFGSAVHRTIGQLCLDQSIEPVHTILDDRNQSVSVLVSTSSSSAAASTEPVQSTASAYSSMLPPFATVRQRLYFVSVYQLILSLSQVAIRNNPSLHIW